MGRRQRLKAYAVELIDGPMAGQPAVWSQYHVTAGGEEPGGRFSVTGPAVGGLCPLYEYEFTAARTARFVRQLGTRAPLGAHGTTAGSP
jgi:hypothetical protein